MKTAAKVTGKIALAVTTAWLAGFCYEQGRKAGKTGKPKSGFPWYRQPEEDVTDSAVIFGSGKMS